MRIKEGNKEKDIIEAAIKVFAEKGYFKSKISKIADVAGVATGSVYVYYENKEDILLKIFEQLWGNIYQEARLIKNNNNSSPMEKLESLIDMAFGTFMENTALAIVYINEQSNLIQYSPQKFTDNYDKFLDLCEDIIRDGINKKVMAENIDVQIFRNYFLGGFRNLLHHWAHDPQNFSLDRIRENVKLLTRHGIQR
jgi:TetR/AcrR family fatty acid metabolism transcriptional regulator